MSRWTELLPAAWRKRFGREIDDLLEESDHPLRDRLDVARLALSLHAQERWHAARTYVLVAVAVCSLLLSAGLAAWAAGNLTHGWIEIPGHWWSALTLTPLLLTALCFIRLWRRPPRAPQL